MCTLRAQQSDFVSGQFEVIQGKNWFGGEKDASARMEVFSDGKVINLFLEVKDDVIIRDKRSEAADHLVLTMALAPSAYPEGFPLEFHPWYFQAMNQSTRAESPNPKHRFFSMYAQTAQSVEVALLKEHLLYPDKEEISKNNFLIPYPEQLRAARVAFGFVSYRIFPDGRPAELIHREDYASLEDNLNENLGDVEAGIAYSVETRPGGMEYNVSIAPQALGFVPVPFLKELSVVVDMFDFDVQKGLATVLSSSSEEPKGKNAGRPMEILTFAKAINTNYTEAPDRIFQEIEYKPIMFFGENGWTPTYIDIDPLVFRPFEISQSISEVQFSKGNVEYRLEQVPNTQIGLEQFTVKESYVNLVPRISEYTLLKGQLFHISRIQNRVKVLDTTSHSSAFSFPDGGTGLITVENSTRSPQGWGDCGMCLQETITIHRITPKGSKKILQLRQGDEQNGYLSIGDFTMEGFQVDRLDWVKEGQVLVFQAINKSNSQRRRIRSSWAEDGSEVITELIP
jgi:hypothetical protein